MSKRTNTPRFRISYQYPYIDISNNGKILLASKEQCVCGRCSGIFGYIDGDPSLNKDFIAAQDLKPLNKSAIALHKQRAHLPEPRY